MQQVPFRMYFNQDIPDIVIRSHLCIVGRVKYDKTDTWLCCYVHVFDYDDCC